jgi:hypothetical protein
MIQVYKVAFKLLPNSFQFSAQVSIELIAIYFHSFEIFNIQIGEMTFCKPDIITYYKVKLFSECSKRPMLFG